MHRKNVSCINNNGWFMFVEGGVGNWVSYFSQAQSDHLDKVMEEAFRDCPDLEFTYELH